MKKENLKLNKSQIASCLRFKKSIAVFLRVIEGFGLERDNNEYIIKEIISLRVKILKIRNESIIFYDFTRKVLKGLDESKFDNSVGLKQVAIKLEKRKIETNITKKIKTKSSEKNLKNKDYNYIVFHLTEIYADYCEYQMILEDILLKNEAISFDLLETYFAGNFYMMNWHTFEHVDDLVSYDKGELLYVKGLMSTISDLLADLSLKK